MSDPTPEPTAEAPPDSPPRREKPKAPPEGWFSSWSGLDRFHFLIIFLAVVLGRAAAHLKLVEAPEMFYDLALPGILIVLGYWLRDRISASLTRRRASRAANGPRAESGSGGDESVDRER